jgi:hypothetical protein
LVEAKDIGIDLSSKTLKKSNLADTKAGLNNLILQIIWIFIFCKNGNSLLITITKLENRQLSVARKFRAVYKTLIVNFWLKLFLKPLNRLRSLLLNDKLEEKVNGRRNQALRTMMKVKIRSSIKSQMLSFQQMLIRHRQQNLFLQTFTLKQCLHAICLQLDTTVRLYLASRKSGIFNPKRKIRFESG